jgi:hypothetical protein
MFRFPRVRGSTSYPYTAKAADINDLELTSISFSRNNDGRHALTTHKNTLRLNAQAQESYAQPQPFCSHTAAVAIASKTDIPPSEHHTIRADSLAVRVPRWWGAL